VSDEFLTDTQIGELLGIRTQEKLARLAQQPGCPVINTGVGRTSRRWPRQATLDWMASRNKQPPAVQLSPPPRRRPRVADMLAQADAIRNRRRQAR